MDFDTDVALWSLMAVLIKSKEKNVDVKPKKLWMKPWFQKRVRKLDSVPRSLSSTGGDDLCKNLPFPIDVFRVILERIKPKIEKQDTHMRDSITSYARLEATLLYLCSGLSYAKLKYLTRISISSLSQLIPETCQAICEAFSADYLKVPNLLQEWQAIAEDFEKKCQFPNCLGAIIGKHVTIRAPKDWALYRNYSGGCSMPVMVVVNANYEIIFLSIGPDSQSSGRKVWNSSELCELIESGSAAIPTSRAPANSLCELPYVFVGDDPFPLNTYLMKCYSCKNSTNTQDIFSYRVRRVLSVAENAFGVLANKFRIFQSGTFASPSKFRLFIRACVALHNLLRREYPLYYTPEGTFDFENVTTGEVASGSWRRDQSQRLLNLHEGARKASQESKEVREKFCQYFVNDGVVHWQQLAVDAGKAAAPERQEEV